MSSVQRFRSCSFKNSKTFSKEKTKNVLECTFTEFHSSQALLTVEYGKIQFQWTVRVFCRFLLHLGYARSGSRMSCFFFPTTRARRPALQKDWMETDGKDATEKRGMIKRAASARRRCSVPTRQKFIRIYTSRNSSSHAADGLARKATFSAT